MKPSEQFKTKTVFKKRENVKADGFWPIALDVGYSAVKGFSPNHVYCFPSYAKKAEGEGVLFGKQNNYDIKYRDTDGEIWNVGYLAQDMGSMNDTNDSESALFGRNRYMTDMFLVITRVGLALGLMENEFGKRKSEEEIIVQAGLPPKYKDTDTKYVRAVTGGRHVFDLKVGSDDWMHFDITIKKENVMVMSQPMGALWSVACDNNGRFIKEASKYFNSKILIFDPGFGTLDLFSIMNRSPQGSETFSDLGMKRVFQETIKGIQKDYDVEISIVKMQEVLKAGDVKVTDIMTMSSDTVDIHPYLESANKKVCMEALSMTKQSCNFLIDYDYMIVDGGTGSAWMPHIKEHLKNMKTLTILEAIQNDNLPNYFSNARGYYMYLNAGLKARK